MFDPGVVQKVVERVDPGDWLDDELPLLLSTMGGDGYRELVGRDYLTDIEMDSLNR